MATMEPNYDRLGESRAARTKEAQQVRAKGPVAAQYEDTVQAVRQLHAALHASLSETEQTTMRILTDQCLTRLTAWGRDSGASSRIPDHRLRRAPKLRSVTLGFLKELHELVSRGAPAFPIHLPRLPADHT